MTPYSPEREPGIQFNGTTLHAGVASGAVLKLDAPLSFWGGTDHDGRIIDRHHPQYGHSICARVLAMTSGRGSSSSSSVLAEQLRAGTGPSAIVLTETDAIVVLGAIVASELYGTDTPVVLVSDRDFDRLPDGATMHIDGSTDICRLTSAKER